MTRLCRPEFVSEWCVGWGGTLAYAKLRKLCAEIIRFIFIRYAIREPWIAGFVSASVLLRRITGRVMVDARVFGTCGEGI